MDKTNTLQTYKVIGLHPSYPVIMGKGNNYEEAVEDAKRQLRDLTVKNTKEEVKKPEKTVEKVDLEDTKTSKKVK